MKKENTKAVVLIILISIASLYILSFLGKPIYELPGLIKKTGRAYLGQEPAEVTRTVQKLDENNILVTLDVSINSDKKALGIREQMEMSPCSEIYDITGGGVEKFNNVIEWLFVDESLELEAERLENKQVSYKIRYEECLEDEVAEE